MASVKLIKQANIGKPWISCQCKNKTDSGTEEWLDVGIVRVSSMSRCRGAAHKKEREIDTVWRGGNQAGTLTTGYYSCSELLVKLFFFVLLTHWCG